MNDFNFVFNKPADFRVCEALAGRKCSIRAFHVLNELDIFTPKQLNALTKKELLGVPGCGPKTCAEILAFKGQA